MTDSRGEPRAIDSLLFRRQFVLLVIFAVASVAAIAYAYTGPAFTSSEVRFTDASRSGLAIVPASCPSSPHYIGQCTAVTTPSLNELTTSCYGPDSRIALSWTSSANATDYHIERCTDAGCTDFSEIGTATGLRYTDVGRTPDKRYRYQVRAHNHSGLDNPYSGYSNINHADAEACSDAPDTPRNLTAEPLCSVDLDSTILLSWEYAVGADEYRIERCTGATCTNFSQIGTATGLRYTDVGRTPDTPYRYRIQAHNIGNGLSSPYSNIASRVAKACENPDPPSSPSNLTTTLICGNSPVPDIMLSWGYAVGADEYRIERCAGTGECVFSNIGTRAGSQNRYTDSNITLDELYKYRALSYNSESGLSSVYSNIASRVAETCDGPDEVLTASSTLWVIPTLVRKGETTLVYWDSRNVSSCSVSGTNGDSWVGKSSGLSGKETLPITEQTIYTLSCTALPNALPPSITATKTVNVIPVFEER